MKSSIFIVNICEVMINCEKTYNPSTYIIVVVLNKRNKSITITPCFNIYSMYNIYCLIVVNYYAFRAFILISRVYGI